MSLKLNKQNLILIFAALFLIAAGIIIGYSVSLKAPLSHSTSGPSTVTFNDSSAGLSFNMSKNFEAIPKEALVLFNSDALYGFRAINDKNTSCVITQTKAGRATAGDLRDGVFNAVKNNHHDAHLDSSAIVQVGVGNGVLLQIGYTENGISIKRAEIAAIGDTNITFAYCQSPSADNAKYYDDFTIFFSSLKLTK